MTMRMHSRQAMVVFNKVHYEYENAWWHCMKEIQCKISDIHQRYINIQSIVISTGPIFSHMSTYRTRSDGRLVNTPRGQLMPKEMWLRILRKHTHIINLRRMWVSWLCIYYTGFITMVDVSECKKKTSVDIHNKFILVKSFVQKQSCNGIWASTLCWSVVKQTMPTNCGKDRSTHSVSKAVRPFNEPWVSPKSSFQLKSLQIFDDDKDSICLQSAKTNSKEAPDVNSQCPEWLHALKWASGDQCNIVLTQVPVNMYELDL